VVDVGDDFLVLLTGHTQLRQTEFLPFNHIVKLVRSEYPDGRTTLAIDTTTSLGEHNRTSEF
jgi:hypothetical protein